MEIKTLLTKQEKKLIIDASKHIGVKGSSFLRMVGLREARKILNGKMSEENATTN